MMNTRKFEHHTGYKRFKNKNVVDGSVGASIFIAGTASEDTCSACTGDPDMFPLLPDA